MRKKFEKGVYKKIMVDFENGANCKK